MGILIDVLNKDFYLRITRIKEQYKNRKGVNLVLILVNSEDNRCNVYNEEDLENDVTEKFDRIVAFLKYDSLYCGYTNENYDFIGIFDKNNTERMIEYDTIAIKRVDIISDFTLSNYDRNIICSSELVFVNNPFGKYLKKVITPIKKSLKRTLPEGYAPEVFDDIEKGYSFVFSQSRYSHLVESYTVPGDFEKYLKMIKEMDLQMTELYFNQYGSTKFKPEDYVD